MKRRIMVDQEIPPLTVQNAATEVARALQAFRAYGAPPESAVVLNVPPYLRLDIRTEPIQHVASCSWEVDVDATDPHDLANIAAASRVAEIFARVDGSGFDYTPEEAFARYGEHVRGPLLELIEGIRRGVW